MLSGTLEDGLGKHSLGEKLRALRLRKKNGPASRSCGAAIVISAP